MLAGGSGGSSQALHIFLVSDARNNKAFFNAVVREKGNVRKAAAG